MPTSSVPISPASPSARAASRVTPAEHSSTVSRNSVAPMFIASSSEVIGEVPGLQSVASAIGTPAARSAATGGSLVSRVKYQAPGSSVATVPAPAIATMPAVSRYSRWSADSAPCAAASAAPPWLDSCSACSFTGRPCARAAANTRAVCAGEKAMFSQNASTASTRPSAASAGIISSQTAST